MNAAWIKVEQRKGERAFTITELLVALAVLFILAGIFLPAWMKSRIRGSRDNCVLNLKQVGLAFRIFSTDNEDKFPMQLSVTNGGCLEILSQVSAASIFRVMSNELSFTKILVCSEDRKRSPAQYFDILFTDRNVSYFIGLDAQESAQWVLAGDRDLTANRKPAGSGTVLLSTNQSLGWSSTLHYGFGNLLFGDASVQRVTATQLQNAFAKTSLATNRLVMP